MANELSISVDNVTVPLPISGSVEVAGGIGILGVISAVNSTDAPLPSGTDFTGVWEDVSNYASINVFAIADTRTRVLDGCHLQFSTDAVNVYDEYLIPYRGVNTTIPVLPIRASVYPLSKYFRVLYRNSENTNQTYFHLQTIYHPTRQPDGLVLANGRVSISGAIKTIEIHTFETSGLDTVAVSGLGNTYVRVFAIVLNASSTAKVRLQSGSSSIMKTIGLAPNFPYSLNLLPFGWIGDGLTGQTLRIVQSSPPALLTGLLLTTRI